MSFQGSPHTPRTHVILCLLLSAMSLLTFIFLLTLAIISPPEHHFFRHHPSAPSLRCLSLGNGFGLSLASFPMSFIQMATINFPSSTSAWCQTKPLVRSATANPTSSKMKWQDTLPQQSHSKKGPQVYLSVMLLRTDGKIRNPLVPLRYSEKTYSWLLGPIEKVGAARRREREPQNCMPPNTEWNHLDFFFSN